MPSLPYPPTPYSINFDRDRHVPLTDDQKIQVGRDILEFFINQSLNYPMDYDPKVAAGFWLESIGFDRVEWTQVDDDILLCLLWRMGREYGEVPHVDDEFILEFAGHDAAVITVFNKGKEWSG